VPRHNEREVVVMIGILTWVSQNILCSAPGEAISKVRMHSTPAASCAIRRWTRSLPYTVALGIAVAGLAGYVALKRPLLLGAQQASAAPAMHPPAALPPAPVLPAVTSEPRRFEGRVLDGATGQPLRGASVWLATTEVRTDADGRFILEVSSRETPALIVKRPGYERAQLNLAAAETTVRLRPKAIKAAYLTYYGVGDRRIRERVLELVGRTELNAVVIDVKGDRGLIPYRTEVPAALEAGALGPVIIKDFDAQLASLKAEGISGTTSPPTGNAPCPRRIAGSTPGPTHSPAPCGRASSTSAIWSGTPRTSPGWAARG
jgi:Putative glycosyl hydrolase domain/Carboxypeptidase regulatory-like domain